MKFSYLETVWSFQVLPLCLLGIFWSNALSRAEYSPPREVELFQSCWWEQALFLALTASSHPFTLFIPWPHMHALISSLLNAQGALCLLQLSAFWYSLLQTKTVVDLASLHSYLPLFNSGSLPGFILVPLPCTVAWKLYEGSKLGWS